MSTTLSSLYRRKMNKSLLREPSFSSWYRTVIKKIIRWKECSSMEACSILRTNSLYIYAAVLSTRITLHTE